MTVERKETDGTPFQEELQKALAACDYFPLGPGFVRNISPGRFPRFHLTCDSDRFWSPRIRIHFDVRLHRTWVVGQEVSQEVQRILNILENVGHNSVTCQKLVGSLNYFLLFGAADSIRSYEISHQRKFDATVLAMRRSRKVKGEAKRVLLKKRNQGSGKDGLED